LGPGGGVMMSGTGRVPAMRDGAVDKVDLVGCGA
jgi:hypothetical protein